MDEALPQKSDRSANGATYKSPGQARSASPWVATSTRNQGLKGRNTQGITPFQGWNVLIVCYQGRRASRLPLALIFRAVGATFPLVGESLLPGVDVCPTDP